MARTYDPYHLLDNLIGYWCLDELSGDALDTHFRRLTLTDTNTVTYDRGIIRTARAFAGGVANEYLIRNSEADLQTGDISFTWSCWLLTTNAAAGAEFAIAKDSAVAGKREYILAISDPNIVASVFRAVDSEKSATWSPVANNRWYHVIFWHDAVADTINLSVNGGQPATTATGGALQAASDAQFTIGTSAYNLLAFDWRGRIDEVGFWKCALNPRQRAALWNGGLGLPYPFETVRRRKWFYIAAAAAHVFDPVAHPTISKLRGKL